MTDVADVTTDQDDQTDSMPSYHDLHITTGDIERASIFNLPYGLEVRCMRTTGWVLYDNGARLSPHLAETTPRVLAGEFEGPDKWLVLDVNGVVIVNSRDRHDEGTVAATHNNARNTAESGVNERNTAETPCGECGGTGQVQRMVYSGGEPVLRPDGGYETVATPCPVCHGKGY